MAYESRVAYSPLNQKIIFGGIPIVGYSKGLFLDIKPNSDIADTSVGADGEIHVNLIANNTATATIKMAYDNPTYKLMRVAAVAFQQAGVYLPFISTNIADVLDTTVSLNSHIIRHSTDNYSANADDMYRTYDIYLHNAQRV